MFYWDRFVSAVGEHEAGKWKTRKRWNMHILDICHFFITGRIFKTLVPGMEDPTKRRMWRYLGWILLCEHPEPLSDSGQDEEEDVRRWRRSPVEKILFHFFLHFFTFLKMEKVLCWENWIPNFPHFHGAHLGPQTPSLGLRRAKGRGPAESSISWRN